MQHIDRRYRRPVVFIIGMMVVPSLVRSEVCGGFDNNDFDVASTAAKTIGVTLTKDDIRPSDFN
jgi:hypothetical protein